LDMPATGLPSGRALTTEGLFKCGLALVSALLVGATAFWSWYDFEDSRYEAEAKLQAAAMVAKGHAVRSLSAIDAVLTSVVDMVERDGLNSMLADDQQKRLRQLAKRLPQTGGIFVFDHVGTMIVAVPENMAMKLSSSQPIRPVSDREWFKQLREGDNVHVGHALLGRGAHHLFFPVARAIRGPDGDIDGAVQVGVEVTYVAELLRDLELSPGAWLGLYRSSDGSVIARHPMTEAMLGESVNGLPFFPSLSTLVRWTGWVKIGDEERLTSVRKSDILPIISLVSIPKREVYAGAWHRLVPRILTLVALWGTLLALTTFAVRQARQEASFRNMLSASEARFRDMADHAPVMVWVSEADGKCSFNSRSWHEFTGQSTESALGHGWLDAVHPNDRMMVEESMRTLREYREAYQLEYRLRRRDGIYRWTLDAAAPRFGCGGEFLGYIGSVIDISERKETEDHIALLLREVNHRAKNLLTVVQVVARHTADEIDPSLFSKRFSQRLAGLAASHDLLVKSDWRGVDIADLVHSQLTHLGSLVGTRVTFTGPSFRLSTSAAQAIGMALHELATNSVKYGALSDDAGRVRIAWQRLTNDGSPLMRIVWSEHDGPAAIPPQKHGFGHTVMVAIVEHELDAQVSLTYDPSGIVWEMTAPAQRIMMLE
jgi:PAS domain S-box-containing protein